MFFLNTVLMHFFALFKGLWCYCIYEIHIRSPCLALTVLNQFICSCQNNLTWISRWSLPVVIKFPKQTRSPRRGHIMQISRFIFLFWGSTRECLHTLMLKKHIISLILSIALFNMYIRQHHTRHMMTPLKYSEKLDCYCCCLVKCCFQDQELTLNLSVSAQYLA